MLGPILSLLVIVFSLLGVADASYLTHEKLSGSVPVCGVGFDCGKVLSSKWATIGPIPISTLGIIFYATVFVFGLLHYLEKDLGKLNKLLRLPYNFKPLHYLQLLVTFGGIFSLYLATIMGVILKSWCQYCLFSGIISAVMLTAIIVYTYKVEKNPPQLLKWLCYKIFAFVYQKIIKPIFFLINPETVHEFLVETGRLMVKVPGAPSLISWFFKYSDPELSQNLAGINFPNPVGLSAGFDYNGKLTRALPEISFGFHTIGTITLRPYQGNPGSAYVRLKKSKGLIVNKGLKNQGARVTIQKLSDQTFKIPTGISIASTNTFFNSTKEQIMDIVQCFYLFEKSRVRHNYYELNISCPNTFGGEPFTVAGRLEVLLTAIDSLKLTRPVFVKMPIDQDETETKALLQVCDRHKIAGVIFGNLTKDRDNPALTVEDRTTWLNSRGNVSGKPTWERSNKLIKLTNKLYGKRFVIIGTGGIFTPQDAQKKLSLGADLVQLITGMIFSGPQLIGDIGQYLANDKLDD